MHRLWLVVLLFHTALSGLPTRSLPAPAVEFSNSAVEYHFDQDITFTFQVSPIDQVGEIWLAIQPSNAAPLLRQIPVSPGLLTYRLDLKGLNLPPFSRPVFFFQAITTGGVTIQSKPYTFTYIDNRFAWKTLQQGNFKLHWYTDQPQLQQDLLRITRAGIDSALKAFPGSLVRPFDLYLYNNPQPLRQALHQPLDSAVIAHAIVESDVILVSDTADPLARSSYLEQQVPHEITHLLQYQTLGSGAVANLPMWLSEGSATLAETYPDPEETIQLQNAVSAHSLIPISSLCQAFPGGEKDLLAYAESASFVRFLQGTYGSTTFSALLNAYKNGLSCQKGIESAVGLPFSQIDETWRSETLHSPSAPFIFENISPYLLAGLLLVLVPLISARWVHPLQILNSEH